MKRKPTSNHIPSSHPPPSKRQKTKSRASRHVTTLSAPTKSIPLSYPLISNVTIISAIPLPFTTYLSSLAESFGLSAFTRGNTISRASREISETSPQADLESTCAAFYASLCHFKHPQPLPQFIKDQMTQINDTSNSVTSSGTGSDVQLREFLQERISRWTQAFTSLYSMLRNGKCPYFYVRTNTRNSVLFLAYGVGGQDIRAIINESSGKMRSELEKYSVSFVDLGAQDEDDNQQESTTSALTPSNPHTLLFQGKRSVHALFNFLLAESCNGCLKWLRDDVPELLSSTPFIYGTLENVEVQQLREHTAHGTSSAAAKRDSRGATLLRDEKKYVLHIAGTCMPHTIHHMCRVFEESLLETPSSTTLDPKLTLNFRVLPETAHLNCVIKTPSLYQAQHPFSKLLGHEASEEEYGYLDGEQDEEMHDRVLKSVVMQVETGLDGRAHVKYHTTVSDKVG